MRARLLLLTALAVGLAACGVSTPPGPAGTTWRSQIVFDPTTGQALMFSGYQLGTGGMASSANSSLEWSWNGVSGWSNLVGTPIPRFGVGTYSGRDRGILFFSPGDALDFNPDGSGVIPGTPEPSLWLGQGQSWKDLTTSDVPQGLNEPLSMAYDSATKQTLLMGSADSGSQLWAWNGNSWNELWANQGVGPTSISVGPDSGVLGFDNTAIYRWTGFAWSDLGISGIPPNGGISIAYMPARHSVVVYLLAQPSNSPQTYVFDGKSWTQISGQSPPTRWFPAFGSDGDGNLLMYGGRDPVTNAGFADTWTFDGKSWKQVGV